jgi:hypothetical protein
MLIDAANISVSLGAFPPARTVQTGRVTSACQRLQLAAAAGDESSKYILQAVNDCGHEALNNGALEAPDVDSSDGPSVEPAVQALRKWMAAVRGVLRCTVCHRVMLATQ